MKSAQISLENWHYELSNADFKVVDQEFWFGESYAYHRFNRMVDEGIIENTYFNDFKLEDWE